MDNKLPASKWDGSKTSSVVRRNLQPKKYIKSVRKCGIEQNNYMHNGESMLEGATGEIITEHDEEMP